MGHQVHFPGAAADNYMPRTLFHGASLSCASQGGRFLLTESKTFRVWPAYFTGVKSEGYSSRPSIRV